MSHTRRPSLKEREQEKLRAEEELKEKYDPDHVAGVKRKSIFYRKI